MEPRVPITMRAPKLRYQLAAWLGSLCLKECLHVIRLQRKTPRNLSRCVMERRRDGGRCQGIRRFRSPAVSANLRPVEQHHFDLREYPPSSGIGYVRQSRAVIALSSNFASSSSAWLMPTLTLIAPPSTCRFSTTAG